MTSHRSRRHLAKALAPPSGPKVTRKRGEIVSVTGSTAEIYLNGDRTEAVGPVPVSPGLVIAVGQIVEVTSEGPAPTITRRIT